MRNSYDPPERFDVVVTGTRYGVEEKRTYRIHDYGEERARDQGRRLALLEDGFSVVTSVTARYISEREKS